MNNPYPHLFSPLPVRGFVLKNRLESANSHPHFLQGPEEHPAVGLTTHYANRAKSGAAIVTVTGVRQGIHEKHYKMDLDFGHMIDWDIYNTQNQNYLLHLTDLIHYHNSIACFAMMWGPSADYELKVVDSPEREQSDDINGKSGDPTKAFGMAFEEDYHIEKIPAHKRPAEYSLEELDKIAESYAQQAEILRALDFDMLSIHFAYRFNLPGKMFSPLANNRTDEYNGSLENRMKYPLEVLRRIRERVGPRTILEITWSFDDLPGGYGLDETCAFLNAAKEYIDIVQLRANDNIPAHPTSFTLEHEPFLEQAAYVKAHVPGLLISSVAGYFDPQVMEDAVAEGKLDIVAQARAWISNPDYGQLLLEGRADELVPCLRCNKCHGRAHGDPFQSVCSVNPIIGIEHELSHLIRPVTRKKRVAVVGGGPAGMRCALYLADRGHTVTVFEAGDTLGGAIRHADYAPFKWTLKQFKDYLIDQVNRREEITIKLNTRATPELIAAEGFDAVVTALGAVPATPPVAGLDQVKVLHAAEAFAQARQMGHRVVIIGGGEVGVEAGIHLARNGHPVTVLEMRPKLAMDATKIHYREAVEMAWEAEPNFTGITGARVTAVTQNSVTYTDGDGTEHTIETDEIVVSAGMKPLQEQALAFYGSAPEFFLIGDSKRPGTIQSAMRQAFAAANSI